MPTTVTYIDKSLPEGTEVAVSALPCLFINGQPVEIDDDAIAQYEKSTGNLFADLLISKKFGGPGRPKLPQEDTPPVAPLIIPDAKLNKPAIDITDAVDKTNDTKEGGK